MTYISINGERYPALVTPCPHDRSWDGRESRRITLTMTPARAAELFTDGLSWSRIIQYPAVVNGDGETVTLPEQETDLSGYEVAGPIVDHRNGTVTVSMGRPLASESLSRLAGMLPEGVLAILPEEVKALLRRHGIGVD